MRIGGCWGWRANRERVMVSVFHVDFDRICTRSGNMAFHAHGKGPWPLPSNRSMKGKRKSMSWCW